MRDLIVTLVVFGALPFVLTRPWLGIYLWSWLGYMNPHKLSWGFAYSFPFAQVTAVVTLASLFFGRRQLSFPHDRVIWIWLLFLAYMGFTTLFAVLPDEAFLQYQKVLKIQLVTLITLVAVNSRERLIGLVWVIAVSLGFFGVKGGLFTILGGGQNRVWGPPTTFIEGNNELALALLMTLPLMEYLRRISPQFWVRVGLVGAMLATAFAVFGSYSRGAFLAAAVMAINFWWKSTRKLLYGLIVVITGIGLLTFMPDEWTDRMSTIQTFDEDESALGRFDAWETAIGIANGRFTGGGFEHWSYDTFEEYGPGGELARDVHSIYFEILGEHGYIGFILFMIIAFMSWGNLGWVIRHTRDRPELDWANYLARMLQVSLMAFAAGGAFLGLAYFDLYWHFVAMGIILKYQVRAEMTREESERIENVRALRRASAESGA